MKKLISIMCAAALVFALAIPAFAAESPAQSGQDVVSSASANNNYQVRILPAAPTDAEIAALDAKAAEIGGEADYSTDMVSVEVVDGTGNVVTSQYFSSNTAILVSFVRNDAREVLAVLAWNAATQQWDSVSFTQDGSSVFATFPHLCNVAFVVKGLEEGMAASSTAGSADAATDVATTGAETSAQTGYTTIVWAVLAIVAIAGAGVCFKSSKKSAVSAA